MKRDNRTETGTKKRRRRKKSYLLRFFVFVVLCVGLYLILHIDYFTINGVAVVGNEEITDEEILELSEIKTGENIFDVHPWFVERKIKKNLYIGEVNVKRRLPDKIEIEVTERSGKAQFSMGKKYVVTDNEGTALEISDKMQEVTYVTDMDVKEAKLGKTVELKEDTGFDNAMSIIKAAEDGDLYFKKLKIKSNRVKAYVYDKLVCKGKYDNMMDAIKNETLKAVLYDLYQKGKEEGTVTVGSNGYCSFSP